MHVPFVNEINHNLARMAWGFWTTLGVAGVEESNLHALIPLEELILLTAAIADYDPRLRDESLDWCSRYHHFVSVSRLRALVQELGEQIYEPFSIFAATLNAISSAKWPLFAQVTPLPITCSGKSQRPNCQKPELLGLRLRSLFGVGARADLIAFLLTQPAHPFTAADAMRIGYNKRTLADVLDHFVQAGLLTSSMVRNQRRYTLLREEELKALVAPLPKITLDLQALLTLVITLRTVVEREQSGLHSRVVAVRNMLRHLNDTLNSLNLSPPKNDPDPSVYWDGFTQWFCEITRLLTIGGKVKMMATTRFEENTQAIIQPVYRIDDCIDGLWRIIVCSSDHPTRHKENFRACYELSRHYLNELKAETERLLNYPSDILEEFGLLEIIRRYRAEGYPSLCRFIDTLPPESNINNAGAALMVYGELEKEIKQPMMFIHGVKQQLEEAHVQYTGIVLLTTSPLLHKRHEIAKLFQLYQ